MDNLTYTTLLSWVTTEDEDARIRAIADTYMTSKFSMFIHVYYLPVACTLGFIGNILSFCVMMQVKRVKYLFYLLSKKIKDVLG